METSKVAEIRFTFSSIDEKVMSLISWMTAVLLITSFFQMPRITEGSIRQAFEKDVGQVHDVGIRLHRTSPEV